MICLIDYENWLPCLVCLKKISFVLSCFYLINKSTIQLIN